MYVITTYLFHLHPTCLQTVTAKIILTPKFLKTTLLCPRMLESLVTFLEALQSGENTSQPAFTCSKLTIETLEQGVKYVQI